MGEIASINNMRASLQDEKITIQNPNEYELKFMNEINNKARDIMYERDKFDYIRHVHSLGSEIIDLNNRIPNIENKEVNLNIKWENSIKTNGQDGLISLRIQDDLTKLQKTKEECKFRKELYHKILDHELQYVIENDIPLEISNGTIGDSRRVVKDLFGMNNKFDDYIVLSGYIDNDFGILTEHAFDEHPNMTMVQMYPDFFASCPNEEVALFAINQPHADPFKYEYTPHKSVREIAKMKKKQYPLTTRFSKWLEKK